MRIMISGCEVYAYDHTITAIPHTKHDNLHFVTTGLGPENQLQHSTSNGTEVFAKVKTLDTILRENGHADSVINYLKVPC